MKNKVPVVMYHSVGVPHPSWVWNFLTIPYVLFEDHVRFLKKKQFTPIGFSEYYNHVKHGADLPFNPVFFNFDDGYLDNWVFAYPILKKYGFKGTIFVNPEFVDPSETLRPTLEDVWQGQARLDELQVHGFLSWSEMRKMEQDGVMDIQSHAMTHTWYFSGPEIVDFRHPGDQYVWMDWNDRPDQKWNYLSGAKEVDSSRFGMPVYKHGKSLEVRRYFPDERVAKHLQEFVSSQDNGFFQKSDWKDTLHGVAEEFIARNPLQDIYETDEEYSARLRWELGESKRILQSNLSKEIDFLCWPGGGYQPEAIEISKEYYRGSTIASRDKKGIFFKLDNDHLRIERMGCPYVERNGQIQYTSGRYLYHSIREYQGGAYHRTFRRMLKLWKILGGTA